VATKHAGHTFLETPLRGLLAGGHLCRGPDGSPWQPVGQWQWRGVESMNPLGVLAGPLEVRDVKNAG
jgi:hypothetical protein